MNDTEMYNEKMRQQWSRMSIKISIPFIKSMYLINKQSLISVLSQHVSSILSNSFLFDIDLRECVIFYKL